MEWSMSKPQMVPASHTKGTSQASTTPCLSWLFYHCSQGCVLWRHWGEDSNFFL